MSKPAVSILVPVYKVEKYLARCLDSVLAQDFADWEMVLVDDGSPDRCPQICDEYAARDARIRVVHQPNAGVMMARLTALQHSKADYVMFVDSDDWMPVDAVGVLYRATKDGGYDIVRGCNHRVQENGSVAIERSLCYDEQIEGAEAYLRRVISYEVEPYLWGAIYRRELFPEKCFRQLNSFKIGEDWLMNVAIGCKIRKMRCIPYIVYCYFIGSESIMQSAVCSFKYADRVAQLLDQLTADASEENRRLVEQNRMVVCVRNFFVPELSFSWCRYKIVRTFLKDRTQEKAIRALIDPKFMAFIRYPWIYFLYTRCYCWAFRYLKLRGGIRKVLL